MKNDAIVTKEIRISWRRRNGAGGAGLWHPANDRSREKLMSWVASLNGNEDLHHWIEERGAAATRCSKRWRF